MTYWVIGIEEATQPHICGKQLHGYPCHDITGGIAGTISASGMIVCTDSFF